MVAILVPIGRLGGHDRGCWMERRSRSAGRKARLPPVAAGAMRRRPRCAAGLARLRRIDAEHRAAQHLRRQRIRHQRAVDHEARPLHAARRRRPADPLPLRVGRHHRALAAFVVPAHRRSPKAVQIDNTRDLALGRLMRKGSKIFQTTANLLCRSCVGSPSASPGPVRHSRYADRTFLRANMPTRAYPAHRPSTLLPVQPIVS